MYVNEIVSDRSERRIVALFYVQFFKSKIVSLERLSQQLLIMEAFFCWNI